MTRWVAVLATGLVLLLALAVNATAWAGYPIEPWLGIDLALIREFGERWLETGSMYLPAQTAGPYSVWWTYDMATTPSLYPPAAGPVFGLLALLPLPVAAIVWWGVPVGILVGAIYRWRPAPWTWPLMVFAFALPLTPITYIVGGTNMWMAALVALGLMYRWPAALILLKPTLAPFALIGIRDPRWWITAGVVAVVTFLGPWRDYITAVANGTDSGGLTYSLTAVPLMLVPVIAWLGRAVKPVRVIGGVGEQVVEPQPAELRPARLDGNHRVRT